MIHADKNPRLLYEDLLEALPAGRALSVTDMLQALRRAFPAPRPAYYVKALMFQQGRKFPEVRNVKDQFMFKDDNDWTAFEVLNADAEQEATLQSWIDDLEAVDRDAAAEEVSVYMLANGENGQKSRFSLIFDDETNVVFVVKDLAGTGHDWNDVRSFVASLTDLVKTYGLDGLDAGHVAAKVPDVSQKAERARGKDPKAYGDCIAAIRIMLCMLRPELADALKRAMPAQQQLDLDALKNAGHADLKHDDDGPAELNVDNIDNEHRAQDDDDEVFDKLDADEPEKPAEPEKQWPQNWNGLNVVGAVTADDFVRRGDQFGNNNETLLFSMFSEEQVKRQLDQYPREVVQRFAQGDVRFFQIPVREPDAADPTHRELRYFFLVQPNTHFVWKQIKKKQSGVFKSTNGGVAVRTWLNLFRDKSMKSWKSFVYRFTSHSWKNDAVEILYANADRFIEQPNGVVVPAPGAAPVVNQGRPAGQQQQQQQQDQKQQQQNDRRSRIVAVIYNRLKEKAVGKIQLFKTISKKPEPGKKRYQVLIKGAVYNPQLRKYGKARTMTDDDAKILAQNYDNWQYNGNEYYAVIKPLEELTDENTITPEEMARANPAPLVLPDRVAPQFDDEATAEAQAQVDTAVKALRRMVHVDLMPQQDGSVQFTVKIPGARKEPMMGAEAEAFLTRFRLWNDALKPIYDAAAKKFDKLDLVLSMNNRIEK